MARSNFTSVKWHLAVPFKWFICSLSKYRSEHTANLHVRLNSDMSICFVHCFVLTDQDCIQQRHGVCRVCHCLWAAVFISSLRNPPVPSSLFPMILFFLPFSSVQANRTMLSPLCSFSGVWELCRDLQRNDSFPHFFTPFPHYLKNSAHWGSDL